MAPSPARVSWIAAISLIVLAICIAPTPATAQNAAAESLFADGERLLKAGEIGPACDAFEASNRLEPRAGTLVNLGTCRELNRQLASAWSAYKDAATRAKDPKKKKVATARIKELEPRLSYLTISVSDESRIDGLVVTRDGVEVDPALWNRGVPIDGGTYVVSGKAPGHEEWSTKVEVPIESGKVAVEVPRFKELAKLTLPPPDPTPPPEVAPATAADAPAPAPGWFTGRRKLAVALLGVGVAAGAGGVALGLQASSAEDDAFALCPNPSLCADAAEANDLMERSRSRALYANISYGVAGAAAVGAVVLWLTGAPPATESRVALTPRLGAVAGLDVTVRF